MPEEDGIRLESLCLLFGVGLVLSNRTQATRIMRFELERESSHGYVLRKRVCREPQETRRASLQDALRLICPLHSRQLLAIFPENPGLAVYPAVAPAAQPNHLKGFGVVGVVGQEACLCGRSTAVFAGVLACNDSQPHGPEDHIAGPVLMAWHMSGPAFHAQVASSAMDSCPNRVKAAPFTTVSVRATSAPRHAPGVTWFPVRKLRNRLNFAALGAAFGGRGGVFEGGGGFHRAPLWLVVHRRPDGHVLHAFEGRGEAGENGKLWQRMGLRF